MLIIIIIQWLYQAIPYIQLPPPTPINPFTHPVTPTHPTYHTPNFSEASICPIDLFSAYKPQDCKIRMIIIFVINITISIIPIIIIIKLNITWI